MQYKYTKLGPAQGTYSREVGKKEEQIKGLNNKQRREQPKIYNKHQFWTFPDTQKSEQSHSMSNQEKAIQQYQAILKQFLSVNSLNQQNISSNFNRINPQIQGILTSLKRERQTAQSYIQTIADLSSNNSYMNGSENSTIYGWICICNERKAMIDTILKRRGSHESIQCHPMTQDGLLALQQLQKYKSLKRLEEKIKTDCYDLQVKVIHQEGRTVNEYYMKKNIDNQPIESIYYYVKEQLEAKNQKGSRFNNQRQYQMKVLYNQIENLKGQLNEQRAKNRNTFSMNSAENHWKYQLQMEQGKNINLCKQLLDLRQLANQNIWNRDQQINNLKQSLSQAKQINRSLLENKEESNSKLSEQSQQIAQLQGQLHSYFFRQKQLQVRLNHAAQKQQEMQRQMAKLKDQCKNAQFFWKSEFQGQLNHLRQMNHALKLQKQNYQKSSQQQWKEIQGLRDTKEEFERKLKQKQKEIIDIKNRQQSKQGSVLFLSAQLDKLKLQNSEKKNKIEQAQRLILSKNIQIEQLNKKQKELNQQLVKLTKHQSQQQERIKMLQTNILRINEQKNTIDRNLRAKIKQIQQLIAANDSLHIMLEETSNLRNFDIDDQAENERQSRIKQLESNISSFIQKIDEKSKAITILESELKTEKMKNQQNNSLIITIQQLQLQNKQLQKTLSHIKQSKIDEESKDKTRINSFFQHQLLEKYYAHKQFLTEVIEDRYNSRIKKTKLIYSFDPISKANFHQYIDNLSNIVVIIKTVTAMFLAAYSQGCFAPKKVSDKDGMIISISNKKIYTPSEANKKAITYDDYYIIFGNSEVRLKSLEKKVFSNFGISNCYYNTKGEKVEILLGGGPQEREMDIQSYEIYQVFFDDY